MKELPIGVTCGDVGGIGLECFFRAWVESKVPMRARLYANKEHIEAVAEILPDPSKKTALDLLAGRQNGTLEWQPLDQKPRSTPVLGVWNPEWLEVSREALERSIREALAGELRGVVTLPITKRIVHSQEEPFPGQTELFAARCGVEDFAMMLAAPKMKVVPISTHIPLKDVAHTLRQSEIERMIRLVHRTLEDRFGVLAPTLALCGLNPHAGEGGLLGNEEEAIIGPAIRECEDLSGSRIGPLAADTLFPMADSLGVDAILSMYHDQGLIPFKLLHFNDGVNTTLGLPFVRTSPDHGVAYAIAGIQTASPASTQAALEMAWGTNGPKS